MSNRPFLGRRRDCGKSQKAKVLEKIQYTRENIFSNTRNTLLYLLYLLYLVYLVSVLSVYTYTLFHKNYFYKNHSGSDLVQNFTENVEKSSTENENITKRNNISR